MITIVPYDMQWPKDFERLQEPLHHALGYLAVTIDHIGSTAVPSLAAKDVIDIQVSVRALTPEIETALSVVGYERLVHITADHRPPQVSGPDED